MEEAQVARTEEFHAGLYEDGWLEQFLDPARLDAAAERVRSRLRPIRRRGRTGRWPRLDHPHHRRRRRRALRRVTCSNGTGSGVIVPGTGVHVNNMLGEEDLNPLGFHTLPAGRRVPSMMSPTVVLREGELEAGLGSGGSNRIRSAVLQTIIRLIDDGMEAAEAVEAPRVHFEAGAVQAEPGIDPRASRGSTRAGTPSSAGRSATCSSAASTPWPANPETGELRGGGDPRRGGAIAVL